MRLPWRAASSRQKRTPGSTSNSRELPDQPGSGSRSNSTSCATGTRPRASFVSQPPVGRSRSGSALQLADSDGVDEAAVLEIAERTLNRVGRLAEERCDLLVAERPVLLEQLEDGPLHAAPAYRSPKRG